MADRPVDKARYYDPSGTAQKEYSRRKRMQSILDQIQAQDPNSPQNLKKKKKKGASKFEKSNIPRDQRHMKDGTE